MEITILMGLSISKYILKREMRDHMATIRKFKTLEMLYSRIMRWLLSGMVIKIRTFLYLLLAKNILKDFHEIYSIIKGESQILEIRI